MHVAQFVQRYPPAIGGSEAYSARLCEYLAGQGDAVTVWTSTAIDLEEFWHGGRADFAAPPARERIAVKRYRPWRFPGRRYVLKGLSLVPHRLWQALTLPCNPVCPAMWREAGRFGKRVDVVHATAFPYTFPISCGLRLARRANAPFLLTPFLHLGDPNDPNDHTRQQYTQPCLRWLLKQADRVFVQTRAELRAAVDLGVPEERVRLQGLGVDAAECTGGDREAARRAWGVTTDETVIGHLANNSVEKGTADLLSAFSAILGRWDRSREDCRSRPRVVLAGPEMPNFRRFWDSYPRRNEVLRLGVLSEAQKRDFYAGIDVFCLPSRTDSFGLVILEAWANGKPVIVYRAGGPAELVRNEIDGLVVSPGAIGELSRSLIHMARDRTVGTRLGDAGRRRIAGDFHWADKLGLVRRVMTEVVEQRQKS